MASVNKHLGAVRRYLRFPDERMLSDGIIAEFLLDKITYYLTELNLTDQNWVMERWLLPVDSGTSTYNVNPKTPWGRGVLCETIDESDPYHRRREIRMVDFQDRDQVYRGPNTAVSATTYPHTAATMSFYRAGGQLKVVVDPIPSVPATYQFWYEPAILVPQSLADQGGLLANFDALLAVDTALSCLPDAVWAGMSGADNQSRRQEIGGALSLDLQRYVTQFDNYKTKDRQEQTADKIGFGDDWDFDLYYTG